MGLTEVFLIIKIIAADKPPMHYTEPMPDLATCLKEAEEFLNHDFPDTLGAREVGATCKGEVIKRQSS